LFFSPHCVDTEWFAARATPDARARLRAENGIAANARVLLFAGKLVPFKRPLDLVAAAARVRWNGAQPHLLVAGAGELAGQVERAAAENHVPLTMLGFRNQSEMPAVYAAADILVLPSDGRETWGLVANEALACGRPVILSDGCGAAADLAADGSAGRAFPVGDLQGLATAIEILLDRPPRAEAVAMRSRSFGLDAAADGIALAVHRCRRHSA
jgi:glycosyltransferase involved in cell wall biosynthesis